MASHDLILAVGILPEQQAKGHDSAGATQNGARRGVLRQRAWLAGDGARPSRLGVACVAASKVVLKTSTYPTKQNVAYGTIQSTDPRTKVGGLELGVEFALVRIGQPILDSEELVREVFDSKTIGEAFSSRYIIAWPSAFVS
ncbi:hypothetical protein D1007_04320 [Hordeum vulgare]|nr:hypothetical protein D1007_04320 [Hordeum vulgare]